MKKTKRMVTCNKFQGKVLNYVLGSRVVRWRMVTSACWAFPPSKAVVILECAKAFPKPNHMKGYADHFVIIKAALTFPTQVMKLSL